MSIFTKLIEAANKKDCKMVNCPKCKGEGGTGWITFNGQACYKCSGTGKVANKWMKIKLEVEGKEQALNNAAEYFAKERERIERNFSKDSERYTQFEESVKVARDKVKARLAELVKILEIR
jgi:RecJ-like exonuclease